MLNKIAAITGQEYIVEKIHPRFSAGASALRHIASLSQRVDRANNTSLRYVRILDYVVISAAFRCSDVTSDGRASFSLPLSVFHSITQRAVARRRIVRAQAGGGIIIRASFVKC